MDYVAGEFENISYFLSKTISGYIIWMLFLLILGIEIGANDNIALWLENIILRKKWKAFGNREQGWKLRTSFLAGFVA